MNFTPDQWAAIVAAPIVAWWGGRLFFVFFCALFGGISHEINLNVTIKHEGEIGITVHRHDEEDETP